MRDQSGASRFSPKTTMLQAATLIAVGALAVPIRVKGFQAPPSSQYTFGRNAAVPSPLGIAGTKVARVPIRVKGFQSPPSSQHTFGRNAAVPSPFGIAGTKVARVPGRKISGVRNQRRGSVVVSVATAFNPGSFDSNFLTESHPSSTSSRSIESDASASDRDDASAGSLAREIATLGLPALGGMLIDPIMSLVDTACVGQISSVQLAAMAPCTSIYQFLFNACFFLSAATTNLVAARPLRGTGQDALDPEEVERRAEYHERVVSGASVAALALGTAIAAALILKSNALLALAGAGSDPALVSSAQRYLNIRALGLPPVLFATVLQGASLGRQDAKTPLKIFACAGVLNLVGDVYLTLHRGWGIAGAAAATVAAQFAAAAFFAYRSYRLPAVRGDDPQAARGVRLTWRGLPTREMVRSFTSVASTMLMRAVANMAGYSLMTKAAAAFGSTALAAHQVVLQVWWMLSYFPEPMVAAAQSLVARDMAGASRRRVRKLVRVLYGMSTAAGVGIAAVTGLALTSPAIAGLLVNDISVHALMAKLAPSAVLAQVLCPLVTVSDGVCVGAGDFRHMPVMTAASTVAKVLALGIVGSRGLGIDGIWMCLNMWFGIRVLGHLFFSKKIRDLLWGTDREVSYDDRLGAKRMVVHARQQNMTFSSF